MLLPLLDFAPELQSLFVLLLVDTATAGRLAQASSACKELLQHRLDELREERRGVEQARMEETKQRKRTAILWCFEEVDGGAFYECKLLCTADGTPCGCRLRASNRGRINVLSLKAHLECKHAALFAMMKQLMQP